MKGLIIKKEFLDKILDGSKKWEIRKRNTKYRGKIALISRGLIFGVAELVDSFPVSPVELLEKEEFHRARKFLEKYAKGSEKLFVWVIENPQRLKKPVRIETKGARVWVKIGEKLQQEIERLLEG